MVHPEWGFSDRYELLEGIGAGGSGAVWRARDRRTGEDRAVKTLRPELVRDAAAVSRLYAALAAVGALAHPNIVGIDDVLARDGQLALISRLVRGDSLLALLARNGPMPPAVASQFMAQLCDALAAAHAVGVPHGDVKPTNVIVEPVPDGFPNAFLSDFGIAPLVNGAAMRGLAAAVPSAEYLAPELAPAAPATPASDVYATGIVLYQALSGQVPFTGPDPAGIAELHRTAQPPSIPGLPNPLWLPIAACLDKNPQHRPSASDLAGLLRDVGPLSDPVPPRPGGADEPTRAFEVPTALLERALADRALANTAPAITGSARSEPAPTARDRAVAGHGSRGRREERRRSYTAEIVVAAVIVVLCIVVAALVNNSGGRVTPGGPARIVAAPAPTGTATSASAFATPDASPSPSASPSSASPTAPPSPTAVATSPSAAAPSPSSVATTAQGPISISWQCKSDVASSAGIRKTSCIGIGSDHQLYARGSFDGSWNAHLTDIKVSLINANGGGVVASTSTGCAGSPCSLVTGPFGPPPGTYLVVSGVDDSTHNEDSPTISYP